LDDETKPGRQVDYGKLLMVTDSLLRALGTRALTFAALIMTFALFSWAMWLQTILAFGVAGAFAIGVLGPVLWIGHKQEKDDG
jgi:hypothetical protein